ncbi:hypothetical protein LSTR_LSTR000407 [Laodelphax striatellus]|uniref:Mediator of RNA polymerase II transcription subunit 13 n=1 Tax=Laodelphax striatellus TaxID=195883 RepID=A0A482X4T7_LAOST|nr:hypothetical protein LSTR_LSTR000407 [Laodelphax striatellus]
MTHPNHQTNGASLEDCHTNFFALTDLCGIKWRKLVWGEPAVSAGAAFRPSTAPPLEDPVLASFSRCLAADILCVWRRVAGGGGGGLASSLSAPFDSLEPPPPPPPSNHRPPLSLRSAKELWIFWYGEEPDLTNLVAPELLSVEGDQGSWENGLSYECRSLLFKALHNLIERCLLSRDFVRLGKWFVQPYDGSEVMEKSGHLSFSFAFFVHGESTVCASVDVRQHPPVRSLIKAHLQQAHASNNNGPGVQVILAPYGLAGTLTGQSFKAMEPSTHRLLDEWHHFYPIDTLSHGDLPPVVEVVVGGVKMRYPSCYVLVTDLDESTTNLIAAPASGIKSSCVPSTGGVTVSVVAQHQHHPDCMAHMPTPASVLPERVWQDSTLALPSATASAAPDASPAPNSAASAAPPPPPPPGHWDFQDPVKKQTCSCSKCKARSGGANGSKQSKGRLPFHRRPSTLPEGTDLDSEALPPYRSTSSYSGHHQNDSLPVPSVGSPQSVAPSPLPNPHSVPAQGGPASVPPPDPIMPTLSPQPPHPASSHLHHPSPIAAVRTPTSSASDFHQPKSVSSVNNQVFSPYPSALSVEASKPVDSVGGPGSVAPPPPPAPPPPQEPPPPTLKRPILSSKDYETALLEEDQPSQLLYDYSTMNAWLNHPVKKFKPSEPKTIDQSRQNLYNSYPLPGANNQLQQPQQQQQAAAGAVQGQLQPQTPQAAAQQMQQQQQNPLSNQQQPSPSLTPPVFIKQEPGLNDVQMMEIDSNNTGSNATVPNMGGKRSDPYEFEEDGLTANKDAFKRNQEEDKKIGFDNGVTINGPSATNIFNNEGLQQSFKDEPPFENSDDTSSDEALQVQTPPGSNKGSDECGGGTLLVRPPRGSGGGGMLRPEELSKMFPTPPSLEHNPVASPQLSDSTTLEAGDYQPMVAYRTTRQDIYPNMGSPQEEAIDDWSYVFKPAQMWKFVGSTKYAPLTNLPSQNSNPITLPSHCVYKPSWLFSSHQHHQDKQPTHVNNIMPVRPPPQPQHPPHPQPHPHQHMNPQQHHAAMMQQMHRVGPGMSPISPYPQSPMTMGGWRPPCPQYSPPPVMVQKPPVAGRPPEADSLVVNILLGDTALNIFRDHNFDSCTLCVCNATPKCVGNIRGADAAAYLPAPGATPPFPPGVGFSPEPHPADDDPIRCNCGFSAVVNRRLSHRSGLFFEDELEITGLSPEETTDHAVDPNAALSVMDLVKQQCVVVHSLSNSLYRAARQHRPVSAPATLSLLEFTDSDRVTVAALEQGRLAHVEATTVSVCKVEEMAARQAATCHTAASKAPTVHRWGFLRARGPRCSQDIVRIMKSLQPLLQDAVQKKCTTRLWEAPYTVSGPLTWRQFHRLAGRGTDDRCEPQPIPALIVGHEKDWLSLSPHGLQYWEKLLLEPYSYGRDIAYIVVAPDNDYILQRVRTFFKELSSTYEVCRLGRHCPITKVLRDGILRVGKTAALKLAKEPVDEWFTMMGENATTTMLKLYAQVCRHHLAPHLSQVPMDRTLLDPPEGATPTRPSPSPMPPPNPSTPDDKAPNTPKGSDSQGSEKSNSMTTEECLRDALGGGAGAGGVGGSTGSGECSHEDEDTEPPAIVVYLVEPFTLGSDNPELQRLACLGLLRCFNTVLANLPDNVRANITLQIISLESIIELGSSGDRKRRTDHMRAQALSVFSQCRRQLQHTSNVKALTGFGTAACTEMFLKNKDEKNRTPYRVYTPPYVLSRGREKIGGGGGSGEGADGLTTSSDTPCSVLYVSYCLSEDQRWLLATATNEQGVLLEKATVNVHIPNRTRRRKASARHIGLQKLMDFILGVMSQSVTPWRLVVGRVGRIGHGELKGWSWLLSRKSLQRASKHLKEICGQCSLLYPHDMPCILSACLVSLEPDSALRMMPDQFTPDERFSQNSVKCQLSTPHDVTCTHILVFPTSATTQSSQTAFQEQHINGPELGDEELLRALNDDMQDGLGDFNDIFTWDTDAAGVRSPGGAGLQGGDCSQPSSPSECLPGQDASDSPFQCNGTSRSGEVPEEVGTLLQQPLALGYLVSTAPTGRMPRWFWSACPHLESVCPAFLKNALHLHSTAIQQNSDELLQQQSTSAGHPLDSQYTTDVLRYVLEGYNALSWLALDSNTHDRLSCLPIHMQVLMQLYHMTSAFV